MKTKTKYWSVTLGAAALCLAGLGPQPCRAVVCYVNLELVAGYNVIANPCANTNDHISTLFPQPPEGTKVFLWDVPSQTFFPTSTFHAGTGWDTPVDLPVGRGFVVYAPVSFNHTFVGEVLQGWLTNFVAGNNQLSLLGSMVPQSNALTAVLEFPEIDGAIVHQINSSTQGYLEPCTWFGTYGWFDPTGVSGTGGPTNDVARAFFVQNPGPGTDWVRHFVVSKKAFYSPGTPAPAIQSIHVTDGAVLLGITNPGGGGYDVQFSTDGISWVTVATQATGSVWTTPLPGGGAGYYRVVQP